MVFYRISGALHNAGICGNDWIPAVVTEYPANDRTYRHDQRGCLPDLHTAGIGLQVVVTGYPVVVSEYPVVVSEYPMPPILKYKTMLPLFNPADIHD